MHERKSKYIATSEGYRELIIDMVQKVSDIWILHEIYRCIKNITKED